MPLKNDLEGFRSPLFWHIVAKNTVYTRFLDQAFPEYPIAYQFYLSSLHAMETGVQAGSAVALQRGIITCKQAVLPALPRMSPLRDMVIEAIREAEMYKKVILYLRAN